MHASLAPAARHGSSGERASSSAPRSLDRRCCQSRSLGQHGSPGLQRAAAGSAARPGASSCLTGGLAGPQPAASIASSPMPARAIRPRRGSVAGWSVRRLPCCSDVMRPDSHRLAPPETTVVPDGLHAPRMGPGAARVRRRPGRSRFVTTHAASCWLHGNEWHSTCAVRIFVSSTFITAGLCEQIMPDTTVLLALLKTDSRQSPIAIHTDSHEGQQRARRAGEQ